MSELALAAEAKKPSVGEVRKEAHFDEVRSREPHPSAESSNTKILEYINNGLSSEQINKRLESDLQGPEVQRQLVDEFSPYSKQVTSYIGTVQELSGYIQNGLEEPQVFENLREQLQISSQAANGANIDAWAKCLKSDATEGRSYSVENGASLLNGELPGNGTIELPDDIRVTTDEKGRVTEWSAAQLELIDGVRDMEQQKRCVLLKDGMLTDDAGHLQARAFGGSPEQINLVPMDSYVNRHGEYRNMERSIEKALHTGSTVTDYKVIPQYEGSSKRPESFEVSYRVDGIFENRFIDNTPRGT